MSGIDAQATKQWFWTDDLARLLTDNGRLFEPPLDDWLRSPVAVRGMGEALDVAEALLSKGNTAAA